MGNLQGDLAKTTCFSGMINYIYIKTYRNTWRAKEDRTHPVFMRTVVTYKGSEAGCSQTSEALKISREDNSSFFFLLTCVYKLPFLRIYAFYGGISQRRIAYGNWKS